MSPTETWLKLLESGLETRYDVYNSTKFESSGPG